MKVSTWIPKHTPLPRTLADVPSSREKPVLCWYGNHDIREMYVADGTAKCISRVGETYTCSHQPPCVNLLYHQPPRPTKLEDVPDRRVICTPETDELYESLWFCECEKWWVCCEQTLGKFVPAIHSSIGRDWQLTDCIVELVEVEVEVVT